MLVKWLCLILQVYLRKQNLRYFPLGRVEKTLVYPFRKQLYMFKPQCRRYPSNLFINIQSILIFQLLFLYQHFTPNNCILETHKAYRKSIFDNISAVSPAILTEKIANISLLFKISMNNSSDFFKAL